ANLHDSDQLRSFRTHHAQNQTDERARRFDLNRWRSRVTRVSAMAHVSVTINGRQYRMACDDGQEHHLAGLANDLDQRIAHLRTTFGEIGDTRLTVMAARTLGDQLCAAG